MIADEEAGLLDPAVTVLSTVIDEDEDEPEDSVEVGDRVRYVPDNESSEAM